MSDSLSIALKAAVIVFAAWLAWVVLWPLLADLIGHPGLQTIVLGVVFLAALVIRIYRRLERRPDREDLAR